MLYVKGYVCIVPTGTSEDYLTLFLFGPSSQPKYGPYENINSNNLTVFKNFSEASLAKQYLERQSPGKKIELAKIELEIFDGGGTNAQNNMQLCEAAFKDRTGFIVIVDCDGHTKRLIGSHKELMTNDRGLPEWPLYGASIFINGFKSIETFEEAKHICWQRKRQTDFAPATIAVFFFRKI